MGGGPVCSQWQKSLRPRRGRTNIAPKRRRVSGPAQVGSHVEGDVWGFTHRQRAVRPVDASGARNGRAFARVEPLNERSEQDSRAPQAHRRRYTPQRDQSVRRYVEVDVTGAHAGARRLGIKIRRVLITSARSPKWAGIAVPRQTVCL